MTRRATTSLRLLNAIILTILLAPGAQPATKNLEIRARHGMVASAHALASQAGVEILKGGGNAVDAAVAAAFAVGVVEPNSNGIGGEGMMVIFLAKTRRAIAIDYRSVAPTSAAYPEGVPSIGHAAAAVPGTVAGLSLALEKYGTMTLTQVLEPAIKLASEGFAISSTLASVILDNFESLSAEVSLAKIFCPDELPLEAGDILKNPDLARSLGKIARGGRDVFYRGELAEKIVAETQARGGFITKEDLAGYRALVREPVKGAYRGYGIISAPPPVGGLAIVQTLQILEHFELGRHAPLSPTRIHLMAEAMKRAMADWRAFVSDPDFVGVPIAGLLAKPYAKARAAEIDPDRVSQHVAPGEPVRSQSPSTTSLSVVDKAGNMVALTQTISDFFGAKVMVQDTGIILNNEMKNFSAKGINALAPGKRMRTTISPTILVKKGKAFATIGTPGAARILTTMPLVISNLIDYKMGIQEAIEMPRFFPSNKDLAIEPRLPDETVAALVKMGYNVEPLGEFDLFFGGAQGIVIDPKTRIRIGGADPRRDGAVVGY
jgi:gamma-glutamyltranspeptidase/glutathione hydrolase